MTLGRVISVQSHVVHGYVGNKAATFPLQVLGFDVDVINSVHFSNHTGYDAFAGRALSGDELRALVRDGLERNGLLRGATHLLTGYMRSADVLDAVVELHERALAANPSLRYVCDPVLGDHGRLYVPPEMVAAYRDKLIRRAYLLTPNTFELFALAGGVGNDGGERDVERACRVLHEECGVRNIVVTSGIDEDDGDDENTKDGGGGGGGGGKQRWMTVLLSRRERHARSADDDHDGEQEEAAAEVKKTGGVRHAYKDTVVRYRVPRLGASFTGSGDLTAALLLGWAERCGGDLDAAVRHALSTVHHVLRRTMEAAADAALGGGGTNGGDAARSRASPCPELRLVDSLHDIESPALVCTRAADDDDDDDDNDDRVCGHN